jgi:hypothetical protein
MKAVRTGNEVLARLLALNAERLAEEVRLGIAPGTKGEPEENEEGNFAEVEDR